MTSNARALLISLLTMAVATAAGADVTCDPSPRFDCHAPTKGKLLIKNNSDDAKDKVIWKWRGADTTLGELGTPTAVELRGNGNLVRANHDAQLSLFRESQSGSSVSEGLVEYGTLDSKGLLSTNMVVKSGARLCARADDLTDDQQFLALAVVHGFLTTDR